jgi:sarcosine oxidase delta subunit
MIKRGWIMDYDDIKIYIESLSKNEEVIIDIIGDIKAYMFIRDNKKNTTQELERIRHGKRESVYRNQLKSKLDAISELTSLMDCHSYVSDKLKEIERSVDFELTEHYIRPHIQKEKWLIHELKETLKKHDVKYKSLDLKELIDNIPS